MDCGAPRFEGPGAKKLYEFMLEASKKSKSKREERKKRLKEFEELMKKKQRA